MNWQLVALASVAQTPWRNGGGLTSVLAQWPTQGDWQWRMSVAIVEQSGPFSHFDGIDRWFAVLEGAGVTLQIADQTHHLTPHSAPLAFDGAAETACELIDGRTTDFNLMVKQRKGHTARSGVNVTRVRGVMEVHPEKNITLALYANAGATIHWHNGSLTLPAGSLAFSNPQQYGPMANTNTAGQGTAQADSQDIGRLRIETNDALWMEIPQ